MKNFILLATLMVSLFGGCSVKEFNAGVDSATSDVTNAINDTNDTNDKTAE